MPTVYSNVSAMSFFISLIGSSWYCDRLFEESRGLCPGCIGSRGLNLQTLGSIPGGGKVGSKVEGGGQGLLPLSPPFGAERQTGKNGAAMTKKKKKSSKSQWSSTKRRWQIVAGQGKVAVL